MTDDQQRIAELEKELVETRRAAVSMMVAMSGAIADTPEDRARLAVRLMGVARKGTDRISRLSRMVAAELWSEYAPEAVRKVR